MDEKRSADVISTMGFVRCLVCKDVKQKLWTDLSKNPSNAGLCCGTLREVPDPKEQDRLSEKYEEARDAREGSSDAGLDDDADAG